MQPFLLQMFYLVHFFDYLGYLCTLESGSARNSTMSVAVRKFVWINYIYIPIN